MINDKDRAKCLATAMPIVAELRRHVKKSGLTQTQLANKAGIPQGTVSVFMHHDRDFSFSTIARIAAGLGLELIICVD